MSTRRTGYLLCVGNEGYPASLELRKVYQALEDPGAREHGLVRVVDETGEDYLYPAELFVPIEVPRTAERVFA